MHKLHSLVNVMYYSFMHTFICPFRVYKLCYVIVPVLGFNDMSTPVGHFVSSLRGREKRDRTDSRGDEREGHRRKRNRNESEQTEDTETSPLYTYLIQI